MIKDMILKADFQPVTQINEQTAKLMFKTEDIEGSDYCYALVEYYKGQRTEAAMRKLVADWYDPETDAKILNGMVWTSLSGEEIPVWLSKENQFNFKSAYDLAVQKNGATLPVTFKMGERNGVPVYHTFETMEEADDFYTKALAFINQTLVDGWQKKDGFDWSLYVDTPSSDS